MCAKARSLSGVGSYDFASRRERLSQPKVRSTIQRLGRISNRPVRRLISSTHHSQWYNAQRASAAYAPSAQITFGYRTWRWNSVRTSRPPSRSYTQAGVTTGAQSSPSVSTTMCRLRPTSFVPRVVAAWPALFRTLDALGAHVLAMRPAVVVLGSLYAGLSGARRSSRARGHVMQQRLPPAAIPRQVQNLAHVRKLRVVRWLAGTSDMLAALLGTHS